MVGKRTPQLGRKIDGRLIHLLMIPYATYGEQASTPSERFFKETGLPVSENPFG